MPSEIFLGLVHLEHHGFDVFADAHDSTGGERSGSVHSEMWTRPSMPGSIPTKAP
jgi:hypothetical protein